MTKAVIHAVPFNETTGLEYKGTNIALLEAVAYEQGYNPEQGWATYLQWKNSGRTVRKGQKGTHIQRFVKKDAGTEDERMTRRIFVVFHFDQTDALDLGEK